MHVAVRVVGILTTAVLFASRLYEDDLILVEVARYFVKRMQVEELGIRLMKDIPPHGPAFIRNKKKADTEWPDVALDILREW